MLAKSLGRRVVPGMVILGVAGLLLADGGCAGCGARAFPAGDAGSGGGGGSGADLLRGLDGEGGRSDVPNPPVNDAITVGPDAGACSLVPSGSFPPGKFSVDGFTNQVVPTLLKNCASGAGCHGDGSINGFVVPSDLTDACALLALFESLAGDPPGPKVNFPGGDECMIEDAPNALVSLANPPGSLLLTKALGVQHVGGAIYMSSTDDGYQSLFGWIEDAFNSYCGLGPCNPFDETIFVTKVQPILNSNSKGGAGCANDGCHLKGGTAAAQHLFVIYDAPTDPAQIDANYQTVSLMFATPLLPDVSDILLWPLADLGGHGAHPKLFASKNDPNYQTIASWILEANGCGTKGGCENGTLLPADTLANINLQAFAKFIFPYVFGNPGGVANKPGGCSTMDCHGYAAHQGNGAALQLLDPSDHPDMAPLDIQRFNIGQLLCQVDYRRPLLSPLLACATGGNPATGCPVDHCSFSGGCQIFTDPQEQVDSRYIAALNFVYAAVGRQGPREAIFFDQKLLPLLQSAEFQSNANPGQASQKCADCHFPGTMTGGSFQLSGFNEALLFADLYNPRQSALYLFPTDLNPTDPFVGGNGDTNNYNGETDDFNQLRFMGDGMQNPHDQGGPGAVLDPLNMFGVFATDTNQELANAYLLHYLAGSQPDPATGAVIDWLIPGITVSNVAKVTDPGPFTDEGAITPTYYAQNDAFNVSGKRWLDFFSLDPVNGAVQPDLDINDFYANRARDGAVQTQTGDMTYLVNYLYVNPLVSQDPNLQLTVVVESQQPYLLYFNDANVLSQVDAQAAPVASMATVRPQLADGAGRTSQNLVVLKTQRTSDPWKVRMTILNAATGLPINAPTSDQPDGVRNVIVRLQANAAL